MVRGTPVPQGDLGEWEEEEGRAGDWVSDTVCQEPRTERMIHSDTGRRELVVIWEIQTLY